MSKTKALLKSFCISMKIKGPGSMIIRLIGFTTALFPVLLAEQLKRLTDELQHLMGTSGDVGEAFRIFFLVVAVYLSQIIITALNGYASGIDAIKMRKYLKQNLLRHKCEVRYQYIENYDDFQKRLAFIDEYAGMQMAESISNMINILQLLLSVVLSSLSLWSVSPLIVLILFVTGIPAALLSYFQQDETFRHRAKWMEEGAMAIHYYNTIGGANNSLDSLQEIRHFSLSAYLKKRWREIADSYIKKKNRLMGKHVLFNTAADFLRSAVYLVILLITAYRIYQNPAIGLGVFTLVFTLSGQLQTVVGEFLVDIMVLFQNIPYMQEFFYLDSMEREPMRAKGTPPKNGEISVSHLSFTYPGSEREILHDISLSVKNGEKIAVVGENGSGKSTFISLLCGMFPPDKGTIRIGGVNVNEDPASVRQKTSVVFQDFAHYEASLRDNITVSDKNRNASDEELMALLRQIEISDVVEEQTEGLNTLVGSFSEKANNLSGGQWQKISLARAAFRKDTELMILDEPTSALDPMAEAKLYRDFASLTGDKTTLLISHRLGIASVVDRILVFDAGRIVEDGSHAELMKKNGLYATMYRSQAKWYQ